MKLLRTGFPYILYWFPDLCGSWAMGVSFFVEPLSQVPWESFLKDRNPLFGWFQGETPLAFWPFSVEW